MYRDEENLTPVQYYEKLPSSGGLALLVDPMLATGRSAIEAISIIKKNSNDLQVRLLSLVATEGIDRRYNTHPDVLVYTAAVDRQLDDRGYIRPDLGDAGDRLYGTD